MALEPDLVDHGSSCVRSRNAVDRILLSWPVMTVGATRSLHEEHRHHAVLACSYLSRIRGIAPGLAVTDTYETVEVTYRLCAVPDATGVGRGGLDYSNSNALARATASVRLWTCSLSKMIWLCPLIVLKARKSRLPISRFESP